MTGQIFCGTKQLTWIEREKATRMQIVPSRPRSRPKLHRVEDAEDPVAAEGITVADQLPTVTHFAEEEEEACPRHLGSVDNRPQQRVNFRRAVEEPHAASAAKETVADEAPRTSPALGESRGMSSAEYSTRLQSGAGTPCWRCSV